MGLKVRKKTVYFDSPEEAASRYPEDVEIRQGEMDGPDMRNFEIEKDCNREQLESGSGNVCITVTPGEEQIGELFFNIQYEGPKGAVDECMNGHNSLLCDTSEWLEEIFGRDSDIQWDVVMESRPCPKSATRVEFQKAQEKIEAVKPETIIDPVIHDVTHQQEEGQRHIV